MKFIFQLLFVVFITTLSCCQYRPAEKNYLTVTYFNGDTEELVIETRSLIKLEEGDLSYIPLDMSNREVIRSSVRGFDITRKVEIEPTGNGSAKEMEIKKR